jgi:hypothetical protein
MREGCGGSLLAERRRLDTYSTIFANLAILAPALLPKVLLKALPATLTGLFSFLPD